jgi:hypothetical protein
MCKSGTIKEMSIQSSASLLNTMRVINKNTQGICFILEGKKLVGVLTDGDIRRSLLNGDDLNNLVTEAMNKQTEFAKWCYMTPPTCKEGNGLQCANNLHNRLNRNSADVAPPSPA